MKLDLPKISFWLFLIKVRYVFWKVKLSFWLLAVGFLFIADLPTSDFWLSDFHTWKNYYTKFHKGGTIPKAFGSAKACASLNLSTTKPLNKSTIQRFNPWEKLICWFVDALMLTRLKVPSNDGSLLLACASLNFSTSQLLNKSTYQQINVSTYKLLNPLNLHRYSFTHFPLSFRPLGAVSWYR